MKKIYSIIAFFLFSCSLLAQNEKAEISAQYELTSNDELKYISTNTFKDNIEVKRYKRYRDGIKVEHGDYVVVAQNGQTLSLKGEHYAITPKSKKRSIDDKKALAFALQHFGAKMYAWESTTELLEQKSGLTRIQTKRLLEVCDQEVPEGELVYIKDYSKVNAPEKEDVVLAYKFIIESVDPFFKDKVYVSAEDGHLILRDPIIKHGTGQTRYAGVRSFPTTKINTSGQDTFELVGVDAISNVLCETRSVGGLGGLPLSIAAVYALSTPIQDGDSEDPCPTDGMHTVAETGDDVWNQNEHKKAIFDTVEAPEVSCCVAYTPYTTNPPDSIIPGGCNEIQNDDVALDAQWGAKMVAQYWMQKHGRHSFDNQGAAIYSFVHYGDAYNNAFWNGSFMTYGDGTSQQGVPNPNGNYAPFTSLDICAHEIGHAICSNTSNLVYQKEAGAMNEAFSDIWGAALERYVLDSVDNSLPYDPYAIGEQVDDTDNGMEPGDPQAKAIRWMDDPNVASNPDTYQGTYYYPTEGFLCTQPNLSNDYCGVHLNSGVMNKWYYLLSMGSGQALSPGSGLNGLKSTNEDEINDLMNTYSISGIGNEKADQITFFAEVLLTPNALFADMRAASILAAKTLYGVCSNEEIQVTNAWYAVGVGSAFENCTTTIEFSDFNPKATSENSNISGCAAQKMIQLSLSSFQANTTITFETFGNAIPGVDFELVNPTISFNGDEIKTVSIIIYDDKVVETETDTLHLFFNNGIYSDTTTLLILDDDILPIIGDTVELLNEVFDVSTIPDGWDVQAINLESTNDWFFNGVGQAEGKAYVASPGLMTPNYNLTGFSHIRLVSPLLDARGRSDIRISFDWGAGGEADAVETTVVFDYGTFQISFDGQNWTDIEDYVGTSGGQVTEFGVYDMILPELANRLFYVGFAWYNDALIGSNYSFSIDNVKVTAQDMSIASGINDSMSTKVPMNTEIAFVSESSELIGSIISVGNDLGCTSLKILENDDISTIDGPECDQRSTKVFNLNAENNTIEKTITIYFTGEEVNGWSNPDQLNIYTVEGNNIDDLSTNGIIISNENIIIDNQLGSLNNYISYTFQLPPNQHSFCLTNRTDHPINRIVMNNSDADLLSLRERIEAACPGDTIRFDGLLMGDTIQLTGPEIEINKDLIIIGDSISKTNIGREGNSRVFKITNESQVSLSDLKLLVNNQ